MSQEKSRELLNLLELEQIEVNLFRGQNEARMGARLFGGQVLAQALSAAAKTVDADRPCHSLHAYFMRPGDADVPVIYNVERIRDGRSFTTRRIKAIQNGEAIFSMDASFQLVEEGLVHQIEMQPFPGPAELEDDVEIARRMPNNDQLSGWAIRERAFDGRSVYPMDKPRAEDNLNPVWVRFRQPVTAGQWMHQCLLAYASDMGLVSTSMVPHRNSINRNKLQMASIDHALWLHREIDVCQWLLYIKETTRGGAARGFNRGSFYTEDGRLVASSMQEGLMRVTS